MKKIRNCIFETNSSSSHSISIAENKNDFLFDTSLIPDENGIIYFTCDLDGEFGWEYRRYNDAYTKALYCIVDNKYSDECIRMVKSVIREMTCCNDIIIVGEGYVDHESCGTSREAFKSIDTLKTFIFDKHSWLFTGNDNGDEPEGFYNVDIGKFTHTINFYFDDKVLSKNVTRKPDIIKINNSLCELLRHNNLEYNRDLKKWVNIDEDEEAFYDRGNYFFNGETVTPDTKNDDLRLRYVDIDNQKIKFISGLISLPEYTVYEDYMDNVMKEENKPENHINIKFEIKEYE